MNLVISILNGTKNGSALKVNNHSSKKLYNADSMSCPWTDIVSDLHSLTVSVKRVKIFMLMLVYIESTHLIW